MIPCWIGAVAQNYHSVKFGNPNKFPCDTVLVATVENHCVELPYLAADCAASVGIDTVFSADHRQKESHSVLPLYSFATAGLEATVSADHWRKESHSVLAVYSVAAVGIAAAVPADQ